MIKLFDPYISWRSKWYALRVLSGDYIGEGAWVKKFEEEFAKKFGFDNFLSTITGTAALEIAYDVIGIKEGDEVITPVLTCAATNVPLARKKAKIVFADIDKTLNMNPDEVERRITSKTKAIVFVDFGGCSDNLPVILDIAKKHNVLVIEDAAQAVGSNLWGISDITCVSFNAIKTLNSIEGGGIICKDKNLCQKVYELRWYGFDRKKFQNNNSSELKEAGYKANMNNVVAAIALGNLRSIDKIIKHRDELRKVYYQYGIDSGLWFAKVISKNRDLIRSELKKAGIDSGLHHYRNDAYELFGGRRKDLPFMDEIENQYLLLPLHQNVSIKDAEKICKIVNKNK